MPNLEEVNAVLGRLEKLLQMQKWIIGLTAAAVLWGARLEFATTDHGKRLTAVEDDNKHNGQSISEIQGRLRGLAIQAGINTKKVLTAVESQNQEANQ